MKKGAAVFGLAIVAGAGLIVGLYAGAAMLHGACLLMYSGLR